MIFEGHRQPELLKDEPGEDKFNYSEVIVKTSTIGSQLDGLFQHPGNPPPVMLRYQPHHHHFLSVPVGQGLKHHSTSITLEKEGKSEYPGLPPTNKYPYLPEIHKDMFIGTNNPPLYYRERVIAVIDIY